MFMSRSGWLAAVVAACMMFSVTVAQAQKAVEGSADQTEAEKTAELVEKVALAAELTAFGRGELADATGLKDFKSPEALVAAGGILLRLHKQTGGKVNPANAEVTEDGKAVAAEGETNSFAHEAAALFDEARALPSKDKSALEAQIKQAELVTERGAVGGPRVISRIVKSGKAQHVDLAFEPHSPASISMRGTGKVQFEVIGPGGKVLWHSQGSWGFYNFQPGRAADNKGIKIKVINGGGPPVAYTITTN
ncbi:hypothetical protein ETAA8_34700 [Anatilimnocola aggregata]|uniref:Uncharacterized protein n=1 Tax=Anatilimnocola aggregata TaxID=2528021 RepID=A0A517YDR4_9BACT|nr:hypothetical protein [Anatilimnocola aggregata]QDU28370.1 hypothetical protein ETAA8_34700 [Anatilimnocola aggregata]